jgi:large subunit ribosomal protein L6
MSRIGRKPVAVPAGVKVSVSGQKVNVEGPKGKLEFAFPAEITVAVEGKEVVVGRTVEERQARALHGLTRALVQNMIEGVTQGYEKKLEVQGVGYMATLAKGALTLRVGYANEIKKTIPKGLEVTLPDPTHIVIKGCDKQLVGQFAAEVRAIRKPEPYKGKGVRYVGEYIKLKPGKAAT